METKSDFWWLPNDAKVDSLAVGVGHHRPLTDNDVPSNVTWYHSLDPSGKPSQNPQLYPLDFLDRWRSACHNDNVYRTLIVYDRNTQTDALSGPFLVDIDNSDWQDGFVEDLEDAHNVTKQVVDLLQKHYKIGEDDMRVFFTGRKGFNIEVRPHALRLVGSVAYQKKLSREKLDEIIRSLRRNNGVAIRSRNAVSNKGTVIDTIYGNWISDYMLRHPYVRLRDSSNKWVAQDGTEKFRMKLELSLDELHELPTNEIVRKAEFPAP